MGKGAHQDLQRINYSLKAELSSHRRSGCLFTNSYSPPRQPSSSPSTRPRLQGHEAQLIRHFSRQIGQHQIANTSPRRPTAGAARPRGETWGSARTIPNTSPAPPAPPLTVKGSKEQRAAAPNPPAPLRRRRQPSRWHRVPLKQEDHSLSTTRQRQSGSGTPLVAGARRLLCSRASEELSQTLHAVIGFRRRLQRQRSLTLKSVLLTCSKTRAGVRDCGTAASV